MCKRDYHVDPVRLRLCKVPAHCITLHTCQAGSKTPHLPTQSPRLRPGRRRARRARALRSTRQRCRRNDEWRHYECPDVVRDPTPRDTPNALLPGCAPTVLAREGRSARQTHVAVPVRFVEAAPSDCSAEQPGSCLRLRRKPMRRAMLRPPRCRRRRCIYSTCTLRREKHEGLTVTDRLVTEVCPAQRAR